MESGVIAGWTRRYGDNNAIVTKMSWAMLLAWDLGFGLQRLYGACRTILLVAQKTLSER
jgi:hypothetical protein